MKASNPTSTIHHAATETSINTTCSATTATISNSTLHRENVTCKRCLSALAKLDNQKLAAIITPVSDHEAGLLAGEMADPATASGKTGKTGKGPKAPAKADLKAKAKAASQKATVVRTPKPANMHMVHDPANPTKTGTLCNIPGNHTLDPALVTCKVCLAKMNGIAPLNAIPEPVKAARKAFRSFVARAAYMAYMDEGSLGTSWNLNHKNMAGVKYQITATGSVDGLYLCNDTVAGNTKQELLDTINRLGWSCGEDK